MWVELRRGIFPGITLWPGSEEKQINTAILGSHSWGSEAQSSEGGKEGCIAAHSLGVARHGLAWSLWAHGWTLSLMLPENRCLGAWGIFI